MTTATPVDDATATAALQVIARAKLPLPEHEWQPVAKRIGLHNGSPVTIVRWQPDPGFRLGGPHLTIAMDEQRTLLGYTHLSLDVPSEPLVSPEIAREAAFYFLDAHDFSYADGLAITWIDRHDESITDSHGQIRIVSGIRVNAQHRAGHYTWVVVDTNEQIMTYERDVEWDAVAGRRRTAMWLHDAWIAAYDGLVPPLEPPYAPN